MVSTPAKMPPPLPRRLRDGLERIANVVRSDRWRVLEKSPLNPTQAQILTLLLGRESKGARVNATAQHIGVSQPTAADSIISLEKKGLAKRHPDPGDPRALDVAPTEAGRALVQEISAHTTATDRALAALSDAEQRELLRLLVKIIRNLQNEGTIAPQRMCVTCRHFRPHVYEDARAPHHCAYVNAPFGAESLRLDCEEHDASSTEDQERVWKDYVSGFVVSNDAGPTSP